MNRKVKHSAVALALIATMTFVSETNAQTLVTDFNTFFENESYASWNEPSAILISGPDFYTVTATGYGSNYTDISGFGIQGAGNTHVQLDITIYGPPEADGLLGPIISFVDADGSYYNYAWFGQTLGNHVLTQLLASPTWISAPGTTPGLDLDMLVSMHMQLDPSSFGTMGAYTLEWNNLNLIQSSITPGDFDEDGDVDGHDFLLWQRDSNVGSLTDWQSNYGPGPLATLGAVPEPGAILLALLASVGTLGFRRPSKSIN
ncbi:hypothetical protein [Bythopirellula polymerisocia]|uniref:PEP-CTERM protein-sorting domain-containing protein n=1 Tax=Bythopirellula polymerisocia TaxID=2528003 RepID=A0A5C6CM65_9BACT|nr:hypothetical protein [Bythopirellula polymerisocia]TWU25498.1 hypothetical protein Pla144_27030 [Bythopirellula polymerisocia]